MRQQHEVEAASLRLVELVAARNDAELADAITNFILAVRATVDQSIEAAGVLTELSSAEGLGEQQN